MSIIDKKLSKLKKVKEEPEIIEIPLFDERGRPIVQKKKEVSKPFMVLGIIILVFVVIYFPALFVIPEDATWDNELVVVNQEMIKPGVTYLRTYPDGDFDGDGLTNSLESKYKTNPFIADTDSDGMSDFAELFTYNTSPTKFSYNVRDLVEQADKDSGAETGTPYKIGNVVLWADNLTAKTYGGVVKVPGGYKFTNFRGWVQFASGGYAYEIKHGIHYPLEYREEEDAYKIDSDKYVVVTENELENVYVCNTFGVTHVLEDGFWGQLLDFLLPNIGNCAFLQCTRMCDVDLEDWRMPNTLADIELPNVNVDESRFGMNHYEFADLSKVMSYINKGKCVLASLYTEGKGETQVIIYGYTDEGHLLVATTDSLQPIGRITISPACGRTVSNEGELEYREWFTFNGLGYSTAARSHLVFLFGDGNDSHDSYTKPVEQPATEEIHIETDTAYTAPVYDPQPAPTQPDGTTTNETQPAETAPTETEPVETTAGGIQIPTTSASTTNMFEQFTTEETAAPEESPAETTSGMFDFSGF